MSSSDFIMILFFTAVPGYLFSAELSHETARPADMALADQGVHELRGMESGAHMYTVLTSSNEVQMIALTQGSAPVQDADTSDTTHAGDTTLVPDTTFLPLHPDSIAISDDTTGMPESAEFEEVPADTSTSDAANNLTDEIDRVTDRFETGMLSDVKEIISFRKIILSILVLFFTYLLLKFLTSLFENLSERSTGNRLTFKRVIPILKITFWSLGIYFVIAGIIAPPIETIITVSASIGIAVGFASQDILRNVFGGIMIILDRPFQVGDKIDISGHYGEVIEIGLRSVRIVTPDDSIVSLPNGELMNKAVSNANSSALDCQTVAEIFLPATVNVQEVRELAYRAAATSRYVYLNKPIVVNVVNEIHYDRFIVKLRVKAYVLDIRYEFRFKSDMTELILRELGRRGILASEVPDDLTGLQTGRNRKEDDSSHDLSSEA
jgi:small-conductance mechanosensitive channel